MYQLGYVIASSKDVVLICSNQQAAIPFDPASRNLLYSLDSASDFDNLKIAIANRITVTLKKQAATQVRASVTPVKSTYGLQPNELAALALAMANVDSRKRISRADSSTCEVRFQRQRRPIRLLLYLAVQNDSKE